MLEGPLPVRILRAAQFHEFVEPLFDWSRRENGVRYVPHMRTQLVAARTVAEALVDVATDAEAAAAGRARRRSRRSPALVRRPSSRSARLVAARRGDSVRIEGVSDPADPDSAAYENGGLLPGPHATLAGPTYEEWLESEARMSTRRQLARGVRAPPENRDDGVRKGCPLPAVYVRRRGETRSRGGRHEVPAADLLGHGAGGVLAAPGGRAGRDRRRVPRHPESPGVVGGAQLQPVETATTVRVEGGETLLTDGPFMDAKEHLGGFLLVEADDLDAALDLAARIPAARMGGAVEVRPLVER